MVDFYPSEPDLLYDQETKDAMRPIGLKQTNQTMRLTIKNPETDRLARELVAVTGESITAAVTVALRERLERFRAIDDAANRTSTDQRGAPNPSRDRDRAER